jgi:hypothetical protein
MASLNLSGNNNNYYRIEAGDKQGTWALTLPSQNDTLATLADVFQLGSPWKFRGTADITSVIPLDDENNPPVSGDAFVNVVEGKPNGVWKGLDPLKVIPVDALIVLDESGDWHELSSSEIDPIFQASPASGINYDDISKWNEAWTWQDHNTMGYLTLQSATALGYGDYNNSIWSDPATEAKISNWDLAFGWGNHANQNYLTEQSAIAFGYGDYNNSVWASPLTINKISNWDAAYSWGDHRNGVDGNKYLTEVKMLDDILDVSVPLAKTDEVLTAVVTDGVVEWQSKSVNVIVEGELIFKGAVDMTKDAPTETPSAGHIYVNKGGEANPNELYDLTSDWLPVKEAKYGDKLAYGDDGDWHNIGNAGVGTDLDSFRVINTPQAVKGGQLNYNNDTGLFTYFKTDAFTESETIDKLSEKANVIDVYNKTETYSREEIHQLLTLKANKGESYSKPEADEMLQSVRQNDVVFLNSNTVDERGITIKDGWNGVTAGPVAIDGIVDIETGSEWTIVGGATGGDVMTSIFDVKGSPMYGELQAVKAKAERVSELEEEVQELKGMVKQLIKGIK